MRTLSMIAIASASLALSSLGAEAAPWCAQYSGRGVERIVGSIPSSSASRRSVALAAAATAIPNPDRPSPKSKSAVGQGLHYVAAG
jgi:hypothetical protein